MGQIREDQTMAALWGKMRFHLMNMKLHTELDISATYLSYMEKQVKSSNMKITTMIAKANEPEPEPAPKPMAKSSPLKKPAGKTVKKVHTKK
jgi:hypothetical protein